MALGMSGLQILLKALGINPDALAAQAPFSESTGTVNYTLNAADGAINAAASGMEIQFLSKAGVGAYTLAAPAVAGIRRKLISTTANAHVVTATNLLDDGTDAGGAQDTLTFAAFPGAAAELISTPALRWAVVNVNNATVA